MGAPIEWSLMIGRSPRSLRQRGYGRCLPPSHAAVWVEVVRLLAVLCCVAAYCALAFGLDLSIP
jgi:hypothetical protein